MKKSLFVLSVAVVSMILISSCTKRTTDPRATCTITFNDTITRTADSIHWDMYNGTTPRMQAFIGQVAVITLWPGSTTTHTQALSRQYLYWIVASPAVYSVDGSGGTLSLTNDNDLLSGTLSATGTVWSNGSASTPATSTVTATFANVKELGH